MAKKHSTPLVAIKAELDESLHELSCAISLVKTIHCAQEGSDDAIDWGVRDQAMSIAIDKLDGAHNRMDKAFVRLANETSCSEAQS